MYINEKIIEDISNKAGKLKEIKAKKYVENHRVEIEEDSEYIDESNMRIKAIVEGNNFYNTEIEIEDGTIETLYCECQDFQKSDVLICKHLLATVLEYSKNEYEELSKHSDKPKNIIKNRIEYSNFNQIINNFYKEEVENISKEAYTGDNPVKKINLVPKLFLDNYSDELKIEFKIGAKRLYKIKDLTEFYDNVSNKKYHKYGDKLAFVHEKEAFTDETLKILEFILKYSEMISIANSNIDRFSYYSRSFSTTNIKIGSTALDELFEIYENKIIDYTESYGENDKILFKNENPKIDFNLSKLKKGEEYAITPNVDIYGIKELKGKEHTYIVMDQTIYRCSKEFINTNLKLLKMFKENYVTEIKLGEENLLDLFSVIMPKLKDAINIKGIDKKVIDKYTPEKMIVKVYLDFNENNNLIAELKLLYGEVLIDLLSEEKFVNIPRDILEENRVMTIFSNSGFRYDKENKKLVLADEEEIYRFLSEDINEYMKKFDVLVTEDFKTKHIKQPKVGTLGIKVDSDLLSIDLSKLDIDVKEIENIMEKYSLKKKYHRLKDGSFLEIEGNKDIEFLDKLVTGMDIDYKELEKGEVRLPVNRTLYLNQLLKGIKGTEILKDKEYKKIVNDLNKEQLEEVDIPKQFENILRSYQKIGFKWLKTLEAYKFGGILADDMGLGKTIQILSVISDYVEKCKNINNKNNENQTENIVIEKRKPSIVISPSSLTLNWENEATKFAGNLSVQVIRGTLSERKRLIDEIENYDLIITSYDLLKRDIEIYKEKGFIFKYIIADEAQYLKNSNTQNAKSIKVIKAETRFALTGTPIENSLAELWSIFDFIMPGYLFSYKKFKTNYETPIIKNEDEYTLEKLKMLIEPFVLRRIKKEVLTELPDKTISVLNNEMGEEQRNVYLSYLAQIKKEVALHIEQNGIERSHIQVLAGLTRLRQICCHPALFLKEYAEGSSKLEQCIEIIEEAIESKHKILLFSGYTSMFPYIEERLKQSNIKYFKLTGSTKVDDRIKMVDEFNENDDIKVFLISLKAGGTGLNLTGADMVIHYDPWWNLSAENQATDRAYRIGQKNNVQVYKLITKNSIEEKIYELQQKKAELTENVLSTKVSCISKMSKDDIMNLFSE